MTDDDGGTRVLGGGKHNTHMKIKQKKNKGKHKDRKREESMNECKITMKKKNNPSPSPPHMKREEPTLKNHDYNLKQEKKMRKRNYITQKRQVMLC